jgi:hypothetical protein
MHTRRELFSVGKFMVCRCDPQNCWECMCVRVRTGVHACVCVCVYIYIYIYMYMQGNNKDLDNEDLLCLKCGVVCNVDSRANINRESGSY